MKSLSLLQAELLDEAGKRMQINTQMDREVILSRSASEGDQFLQITLPAFGKGILLSLETGSIDMARFRAFKARGRHQQIPAFMQGFVSILFDVKTGAFLDYGNDPSMHNSEKDRQAEALRSLLQVTLFSQKEFRLASEDRVNAAYGSFVTCDQSLREGVESLSTAAIKAYVVEGRRVFSGMFNFLDRKIREFELSPRVSGGAVADKVTPNQRWLFPSWPEDLDEVFPYILYGSPTPSQWAYDGIPLIPRNEVMPARVTSVPKTQLTPRIIAMEPAVKQFAQQALLREIREYTDADPVLSRILSMSSQTPNQQMARSGSIDRVLATIDLSEASDRVPYMLIDELVKPWGNLRDFLRASRSDRASVPGYGVIPLAKFASMGSALCFPFEMVHFVCSILAGTRKRSVDGKVQSLDVRALRLYGDDIIVPSVWFADTVDALELYCAKVNVAKSYSSSPFRESCGKEYLYGRDVTIAKYRFRLGFSVKHAESFSATIELHNQLYELGWFDTCKLLRSWFPNRDRIGRKRIGGVGSAFVTHSSVAVERDNGPLQRPEIKRYVEVGKSPFDILDGYGAMLKVFSSRRMYDDKEHLLRAGRPTTTVLQRRWVQLDPNGHLVEH